MTPQHQAVAVYGYHDQVRASFADFPVARLSWPQSEPSQKRNGGLCCAFRMTMSVTKSTQAAAWGLCTSTLGVMDLIMNNIIMIACTEVMCF